MSSRLLAVTFLPSPAKTHDPRMTTCRERDATTPRSLVRKRDTLLVRTCCCCSSSSSPTAGLTRTGENNTIHPIAKIPPCLCALALSLVKSKSSQVGRKKNRIFRLFASSELLNRGRVRRCKIFRTATEKEKTAIAREHNLLRQRLTTGKNKRQSTQQQRSSTALKAAHRVCVCVRACVRESV